MSSSSSSTEAAAFQATLELFQVGLDLMRQNLRRRHPGASDEAIDEQLGQWLRERPADCPGTQSDRSFGADLNRRSQPSSQPGRMQSPIPLPLARLVPPPELFTHPSVVHGQAHVARVMVHAFRLVAAIGWQDEAPRLWAAVYLHDLARTHDGRCHRHGADAMRRFESMPELRELFEAGGVVEADYDIIRTAVVHHCQPQELEPSHSHWRLTSLLKDADGLDRVRLSDLDPRYLRHAASKGMVGFARALYDGTWGRIPVGDGHFEELWATAAGLADEDGV